MKTGYILLIIALLVIAAGTAGYFMHEPCEPSIIQVPVYKPDKKVQLQRDSLAFVDSIKTSQIAILKGKLSKYGRVVHDTILLPVLPCDTGNLVGLLRGDIETWQNISQIQDSINAASGRFNVYLTSKLEEKDEAFQTLIQQNSKDIAEIKRKKNRIIYGLSGSTAALLIVIFSCL